MTAKPAEKHVAADRPNKTARPEEPLVKDLNKHKDEFWWIHPAYRARQSLSLASADTLPEGSHMWVRSDADIADPEGETGACMPVGQGDYADFAKVLYKLNGYRPGPVKGWYVVVCVKTGTAWAVGQLRADTKHPLQLFSDLVFETEDEARDKAAELRVANPGAIRLPGEPMAQAVIQRKAAEAIELERQYRARLSGFARKTTAPPTAEADQTRSEDS